MVEMPRSSALGPVLLAALLGCGSPAPTVHAPVKHAAAAAKPAAAPGVAALRATSIAKVPAGTFGPYVGQSKDGALVVWAAAEGERRGWYVAMADTNGALKSAPKRIADAPPDVGLVVVRGALDASGFTVL